MTRLSVRVADDVAFWVTWSDHEDTLYWSEEIWLENGDVRADTVACMGGPPEWVSLAHRIVDACFMPEVLQT